MCVVMVTKHDVSEYIHSYGSFSAMVSESRRDRLSVVPLSMDKGVPVSTRVYDAGGRKLGVRDGEATLARWHQPLVIGSRICLGVYVALVSTRVVWCLLSCYHYQGDSVGLTCQFIWTCTLPKAKHRSQTDVWCGCADGQSTVIFPCSAVYQYGPCCGFTVRFLPTSRQAAAAHPLCGTLCYHCRRVCVCVGVHVVYVTLVRSAALNCAMLLSVA